MRIRDNISPVPANWPPFHVEELPPLLVDELGSLLGPLYLATLELHRTVYRYEVMAALGRDWSFVNKVNGTVTAPGLTTVRGCIYTAIVVSLCALFDDGKQSVDLRAIINRVLRPQYAQIFREFHGQLNPPFESDRRREHLVRLQRRLKGGPMGSSLKSLGALRNQMVAHLDTAPDFEVGWPTIRDMTIVLAGSANIVGSVVQFMMTRTRRMRPEKGRLDAQRQAWALTDSIHPIAIGRIGSIPVIRNNVPVWVPGAPEE